MADHIPSLESKKRLYIVQPHAKSNVKVIVWSLDNKSAAREAMPWIAGTDYDNPDKYVVTAITKPGDRVKLAVTLYV